MRQLTALDAQFLAMESPSITGHVGSVIVLDPSTTPTGKLRLEDVQKLISERLPLVPPFRWRLAEVPFNWDYPYWVEDQDFDIDFHVRELALPPPPTDAKLAVQTARIASRPLDRSRPLWELYVIQGLKNGRVGLLTKIHHSMVDGMSGAEILGALLDLTPEGREPPPPATEKTTREAPSDLEMLGRALAGWPRYPIRALRSAPRTLPNIEDTVFGGIPGAGTLGRVASGAQKLLGGDPPSLGREKLAPPRTSLNGRLSPHRRITFGQLPLDEVKEVKNKHDATVNDVVVTLCAGALRRWLIKHDELPSEPLVAQVPVSVRTEEQMGTFGNRISVMSAPVFTNEPDPVKRLQRTHQALKGLKARHKALPAELLQDANQFVPPALAIRATRATLTLASSRRTRPTWNCVISNVPGPQFPLYLAGAKVEANYPVSAIADGLGLNITVMSYCGHLDFGVIADREMMPDVSSMMPWLRESLDELLGPRRKTAGRSAKSRRKTASNGARNKPAAKAAGAKRSSARKPKASNRSASGAKSSPGRGTGKNSAPE